jgi:hypothetical protein
MSVRKDSIVALKSGPITHSPSSCSKWLSTSTSQGTIARRGLGVQLADARTAGYDAVRNGPSGPVYIQIKGRAYGDGAKPGRRLSRSIIRRLIIFAFSLRSMANWQG